MAHRRRNGAPFRGGGGWQVLPKLQTQIFGHSRNGRAKVKGDAKDIKDYGSIVIMLDVPVLRKNRVVSLQLATKV